MRSIPFHKVCAAAAISLALLFAGRADAAWYDFARQEGVPEVTQLQIGSVEMEDLVDIVTLGMDDLVGGMLVIRGRAEITLGSIGAVLISIDGGITFERADVTREGYFNFSFRPAPDREYDFQIRALDTTGKSSDPEDGAFIIVVQPERSEEQAVQAFARLLDCYMREDRGCFMGLVSDDFEGDLAALEDAIDDDFRSLENIQIRPNITRAVRLGDVIELNFTFDRRVQSESTGQVLTDRSSSNMTFVRGEQGFLLLSMASPLIFGVSDVGEVATSVDIAAEGDTVLVVSDEGSAVTVTQEATVEETAEAAESEIQSGSTSVGCFVFLTDSTTEVCPGFTFETQTTGLESQANMGDGTLENSEFGIFIDVVSSSSVCVFTMNSDISILDTGQSNLDAVLSVSTNEADYQNANPESNEFAAVNNRVYAVKTDSLFALVQPRNTTCALVVDELQINGGIHYKIQLNGAASFQ